MYILISYSCGVYQFVKPSLLLSDSLKCVSVLAKKLNKVAYKRTYDGSVQSSNPKVYSNIPV